MSAGVQRQDRFQTAITTWSVPWWIMWNSFERGNEDTRSTQFWPIETGERDRGNTQLDDDHSAQSRTVRPITILA